MVAPGQVVAQRMPAFDPRIVWYGLALAGAFLLGALVIWMVDRWRKRAPKQDLYQSGDQLTHFRKLYEQGEISADEFARIRGLLTERMRRELDKPAAEPPPPEPPPEPPPPEPPPEAPPRPDGPPH